MKDVTLREVNKKLFELDDKYSSIYPKFKAIELKYIDRYDDFLLLAVTQYTNQTIRDSAVRKRMIAEENELYTQYNTLAVEAKIIEVRLRNLQQISRNMISQNFTGE